MQTINSLLSLDFITTSRSDQWRDHPPHHFSWLIGIKGEFDSQEREADRGLAENAPSSKNRSQVRRSGRPGPLISLNDDHIDLP